MRDVALAEKSVIGRVFDSFNYLALCIFAFSILYPFWHLVLTSFAKESASLSLGFHLWIEEWTSHAWEYVLSTQGVGVGYFNTILRTFTGALLTLVVTLFAAYPLSHRDLPGRTALTILFLITLFFSGGLVPTYLLIRSLGLINNRLVLILPPALNVYYIIIMRNYLMTIDKAVEESALVDGANYLTILFKIIVPLARPVVATLLLWTAVFHWNAWFDALIYIRDDNKRVLQLIVRRLYEMVSASAEVREYWEDMGVRFPPQSVQAVMVLATIGPIILIYPFVQRYFIRGIMIGSLKG